MIVALALLVQGSLSSMGGPAIKRSPSARRSAREESTEVLAQLELVHQGPRHRLYRADRHGRRLIVKQLGSVARDAVAVASLRHEYEVLRAVDVPGVVKAYDLTPSDGGLALVMDDAGDTNLAGRVRPTFILSARPFTSSSRVCRRSRRKIPSRSSTRTWQSGPSLLMRETRPSRGRSRRWY
jgi:hypothetical protein